MIDFIGIDKIKPAEYNPRKISEKQKEQLMESIQELGFVMPVIVNKANNVIIAGHQRTNAARQLGLNAVPVQFVENLDIGDEIRFNQLHNANATNPSSAKYTGKPWVRRETSGRVQAHHIKRGKRQTIMHHDAEIWECVQLRCRG